MKFLDEFWALIPARKGSKSIRNKNILKINNIPLIGYSLNSANKNRFIKKVIFSSDSEKYFRIAKKFGFDLSHKRNRKTSNDKANDLDVFKDFIKDFLKKKKLFTKIFCSFQAYHTFTKESDYF